MDMAQKAPSLKLGLLCSIIIYSPGDKLQLFSFFFFLLNLVLFLLLLCVSGGESKVIKQRYSSAHTLER